MIMPALSPSGNLGRRSRSDSSQLPQSPDRRATKRQNATDAQNEDAVAAFDPTPPEALSCHPKKPVAAKPEITKKKKIKPPSSKGAPVKNEDDGLEWSDEDITKFLRNYWTEMMLWRVRSRTGNQSCRTGITRWYVDSSTSTRRTVTNSLYLACGFPAVEGNSQSISPIVLQSCRSRLSPRFRSC